MSRLDTGRGLADLKRGGLKLPRKPGSRQAWLVAILALALLAAAVVVGMRAIRPPADRGLPPAPSTVVARPAIPEKWRELQKPLPAATQSGREEEPISVPARSDDDPFAPDSSIARYCRSQGQHPAGTGPSTGPDEVSRIIAAASARNASKSAAEPRAASDKPVAKPKEDAKPPSSPAPETSEPVTIARLQPEPAPEKAPSAKEGDADAGPARESGRTEPGMTVEAGKGESASPAAEARTGDVVRAPEKATGESNGAQRPIPSDVKDTASRNTAPPEGDKKTEAASEKPSAGSDAGKPGTASQPAATASKGGGPTATGAPDTSKGSPTVKESGRESLPAEPAAPLPKPRVEPPLMLVTGIISAGDSAYAIVRTPQGSTIVRPGDELNGVTVKSLGEKSVTVIKEGEEFVLELGGGGKR